MDFMQEVCFSTEFFVNFIGSINKIVPNEKNIYTFFDSHPSDGSLELSSGANHS